MFKTRLLSGIVLVIILIATVGTGGGLLFGFLALISLIGLSELYKVVDVQSKILGFTGYLAAVVYYGILYTGQMQYVTFLTIVFLVVLMAVYSVSSTFTLLMLLMYAENSSAVMPSTKLFTLASALYIRHNNTSLLEERSY